MIKNLKCNLITRDCNSIDASRGSCMPRGSHEPGTINELAPRPSTVPCCSPVHVLQLHTRVPCTRIQNKKRGGKGHKS